MEKIEMEILALANSESQPSSFVVILKERHHNRRLPIVIGSAEAQSIAMALQDITPNRPLTHDLMKASLLALEVTLLEIVIADLVDGVFFAKLVYLKPDGTMLEIDSRTSDALALALRFSCPIFANERVLDEAAIAVEEPSDDFFAAQPVPDSPLSTYSTADLKQMLEDALAGENYERAAEIRDELKRRNDR